MIDLCQWRIAIGRAIGSWNSHKLRGSCCRFPLYEKVISRRSGSGEHPKLLVSITCITISLLILSGDVETNPGPLGMS